MTSYLWRQGVSKITSLGRRLRRAVVSQRYLADPDSIYGTDFYKESVDRNQETSAAALVDSLMARFTPRNVLDIGCGNGLYLQEFARRGVEAIGCDGSRHGVKLCPPEVFVFQHDLRTPLFINKRFDLCLCFEIAEHLPKRFADSLVQSCCVASGTVVFSSAQVGQGGTDHINEQPFSYWDAIFLRHGYTDTLSESEELRSDFRQRNVVHWLTKNVRVYRKQS